MAHQHHPFHDDMAGNGGIPLFNKTGTALSHEERSAMARKRGVCVTCGIKTHSGNILRRNPITNDRVHGGICILCNPDSVPGEICARYERQFRPRSGGAGGNPPNGGNHRLRGTARAIVNMQNPSSRRQQPTRPTMHPSQTSSRSTGVTDPPNSNSSGQLLTAEVIPVGPGLNRMGSNKDPSQYMRAPSASSDGDSASNNQLSQANTSYRATSSSASVSSATSTDIPGQGLQGVPKSNSHGSIQQTPDQEQRPNSYQKIRPSGPDDYRSSGTDDAWSLVKSLKENQDNPDALRRNLHSLRNHVDDPAGAMYQLKDLMDTYRNDPGIMALAFGAVWGVASPTDDKKEEATECGVTEYVIDAIRIAPSQGSIDAAEWAVGSLVCLAQSPENREFIAKKGGVEAIVETLRHFSSGPGIFEWSCRALFMLMQSHDSNDAGILNAVDRNIATFEEANGVSVITDAMKVHSAEAVAQWWAVKLLWCLHDVRDTTVAERFIKNFIEEDCMSLCAKILKNRATSKESFRHTCELLYKLLVVHFNNPPSTAPSFLESSADCIPICARMIHENGTEAGLQASCFRLLSALATSNAQCKQAIAESRLVRAASTVMTQHIKEAALVEASIQFLWVASGDSSMFDYSVVGSLKVSVDRAVSLYKDKHPVVCSACGLVSNLCLSDQVTSFTDLGVNSISKLPPSASDLIVSQHVCRALASVCSKFPESIERMQVQGLINRLVEGLCSPDAPLQLLCSNALTSVALVSEENRNAIFSEGCVSTAAAAMVNVSSQQLAESLLELISVLVTSSTKTILQLPSGTMENILETTRLFPSVQQAACATIRNAMIVSVPGFSVPKLDELIEMVSRIIDSPSSNVAQIIEACGAVWAITAKQVPLNQTQLSQLFQTLTNLMGKYKDDAALFNSGLQTAASGALSGVMQCVRQNPIHVAGNDIDLIISVLDLTIEMDVENTTLMMHLLDVLLTLSFLTKETLIQYGVIVVVIDCMVEHEQHELIQQKGCGILALLASTENLQVNLSIAETDGIDMIVSALAIFSDNVELQLDACRALSHLSIDHESRMLISSQGGLILLVNAMGNFKDDIELLEAACSALLNLSSDAEEQVLAGSSVVDTVVKTMKHQPGSARIQEKGLGVLQNVSMRSRDAKKTIADSGGVNAVTFAIREFMGSPAVLERAYTTMWSLAVLDENQIRIAECGGISLVVNGMMANISYEKVQKQACGCLCTLSSNSTNKTLIRDAGGVDSIVYAMWAHYNSEGLQVEACRALSSLAVNVQTNEVMIATDGEISAIMSAMRRFSSSERLQEHACVALRNFLLSADNANLVRHNADDVRKLMDHASTRFPNQCAERARQVCMSLN